MRIWVDLANTPHVPLLVPVVEAFEADGHDVLLTARDHAQTLDLARRHWPHVRVIGGPSPGGPVRKGLGIGGRASALARLARSARPNVAFSHGSYAQIIAARLTGVPVVTMMDYEFQPANHLSFRLAHSVIVPEAFAEAPLRRAGGRPDKVVRYRGYKEQLYLSRRPPDPDVLVELGLDPENVVVVMRPPPEGALYHRMGNQRFDRLLEHALSRPEVQVVVLARDAGQRERYRERFPGARVPERAVDASSLLAYADVTVGAGGTMTRESAVLGTPTYTVFAGTLAGVDAALIDGGLLHDLREDTAPPAFVKKQASGVGEDAATRILEVVASTVYRAARKPETVRSSPASASR